MNFSFQILHFSVLEITFDSFLEFLHLSWNSLFLYPLYPFPINSVTYLSKLFYFYFFDLIKFYFSKCTAGGTCSCIFTSSWGTSTPGVSGVNHLSSVLWNQFNKSFTKEFLKGCSGQGTTNLQSLRDHSWSYKLIVGNFFTEFVICCFVKQD